MCCRFKISSRGVIPQYFYMPITQAGKEPDFGSAPLKKRCQESNSRLAPLKKRCREPEVDEPPRNHACERADGADGGKPYFWRTKNPVRPVPASDFDWKRQRYHSHLIRTKDHLESMSSLSKPQHLELWKDSAPLKQVKILHLRPCLKHIALRLDDTGNGDCEYGGRIKILKRAKGFICKGSDPLSNLYREQTGGI